MRHFWNWVKNDDETRTLYLEGVIAEESWFSDDITPAMFKEELFSGNGPITLHINSPGGDCIAASQIYTMLMDYPGDVTVQIDGMAASAASVIAMAGTRVCMSPTSMILTATCFISDPGQIPAIAAWLKGSGTVTFANRTGGYYKARIANQIPFEKVLRGNPHCTFAVNFRCYPFFYADAAADITVTASGTIITNPGSVYSEPILMVTGSGDITLMVGTTIVELEGISGSIIIDSVLQEAYQGNTLMNDHMSGEFPVLKPGANAISWTGTVTKVVVRPNWRYL